MYLKISIEEMGNLYKDSSPVDGINAAQVVLAGKICIYETWLDDQINAI